MTRAHRIANWTLAGAGGLLVLAALFAAFVAFTPAGARLALAVANGRDLPVRARAVDGALARRFTLYGVEGRVGPVEFSADTVVVAWKPMALRARHVDVTDLLVAGARVVVGHGADADSATAAAPDTAAARGEPWRFSAARARVRGTTVDAPGGVHLRDATITASGGPDGYRAEVFARGSVPRVDAFSAFVRASGNDEAATADSLDVRALGGAVHGSAFVRWSPGLSWRARLEGDSLQVGGLLGRPADFAGAVAFRARGTGMIDADTLRVGLDLASLDGTLRGAPLSARGRVDIDGARIAASDARVRWGSASASLSGSMGEVADVTLDARVPSLAEILPRARGAATLRGRITGTPQRIVLDVDVTGRGVRVEKRDIPDLDAAVDATLAAADYVPHAADVRRADIRLAGGRLSARGTASWQNGIAWDATLDADDFETSTLTPEKWDLRGPLSMHAVTSGAKRGQSLRARVDLASLSGTIRGRALAGSGKVAVQDREADISALQLAWGDLRVRADGHAGRTLDLALDVNAPDLAVIDRAWRGAVVVRGTARGAARRPAVDATLAADSVQVRDFAVAHVDGRVRADASFATPADVDLTALGVRRGKTVIDTLRVAVDGPRDDHRARVFVVKGALRAALAVSGAYADTTWSGWIDSLDVTQPAVGRWRTAARAGVLLSRAHARLDSLVLASGKSRVSAAGEWRSTGDARVDVDLDVDVARAGHRIGVGGRATGRADKSGVSAETDLFVTREKTRVATVTGRLAIPGFVPGRDSLGTQPVEGSIDADCADIGPVLAALAPASGKSAGSLTAHIVPRGTAGDFRIVGRVALENARFDLVSGLRLRDAGLTIDSDGEGNVSLHGTVTSGGGRVSVTASSARSEQGWINGTFAARGERFQLMNRPDAQVFISPDLEVRLVQRVATVQGDVRVPFARIEVAQVPVSAVGPSPDVIVVEDTVAVKPTVQVRTRLRVALGDSVSFSGFGLRARLAGALEVEDERGQPTRGTGEIQIVDGKYRAYGSELTIDPGRFVFGGGPVDNPGLDVRAFRYLSGQNVMEGAGEMVGIHLRGSLRKPEFTMFSNPPMSESQMMTALLTGRSPATSSGEESSALASAAMMIGMQQGTEIAGGIGKKLAVDEAYLESGSDLRDASFVAGKYLSPKLYVSYAAGLFENTNTFRVRYSLANRWTLQTESGTKANSTDILYWFERGK